MTRNFTFLNNLSFNKDDWELTRNEIKNDYNTKIGKPTKNYKYNLMDTYNCKFYTLARPLQQELINLLYTLEVPADINNFVKYLALNKERREYVGWLFKLLNFINN
jgi:hypothetical protein